MSFPELEPCLRAVPEVELHVHPDGSDAALEASP